MQKQKVILGLAMVILMGCPKPYFDISEKSLDCVSNDDCTFAAANNYCDVCNYQAMTRETASELREYKERVPCGENDLVLCGLDVNAFADPFSQCLEGRCELVYVDVFLDVSARSLDCHTNDDCLYTFVGDYCEECNIEAITRETEREVREYRETHTWISKPSLPPSRNASRAPASWFQRPKSKP